LTGIEIQTYKTPTFFPVIPIGAGLNIWSPKESLSIRELFIGTRTYPGEVTSRYRKRQSQM